MPDAVLDLRAAGRWPRRAGVLAAALASAPDCEGLMLPVGMVLGFIAYGVGSWGYVLVKGYNITLREWFSPLHPYTGGLSAKGMVPQGSLFPTSGKGSAAAPQVLAPQQQAGRQALQTHDRPPVQ